VHYANDQLHQMLCALCSAGVLDVIRHSDQQRNHWSSTEPDLRDISSLFQLRYLVDRLRSSGGGESRRRGIQRIEEQQTEIFNYFRRFFDDLNRLRDLKHYFHERIYACLYEHYYKPESSDAISQTSTICPDRRGGTGRPLAMVLESRKKIN